MLNIKPTMHFAHSGLHDASKPANSLSAIVAAADAGYGVEIDIQVSKDGIPFIIHEDNTFTDTGVNLHIPNTSSEVLQELSFKATGERIATLQQVFEAIPPTTPILLDVKQTKFVSHTMRAVCALAADRVESSAIQSFQPTAVWKAKHLLPKMAVGQLGEESNHTMGPIQKFQTDTLITNFVNRPDFIGMYLPMLRRNITTYWRNKLDCPFLGWTVVDEEDMELCLELGVSMIFEKVRP
jgi:glycerophosphoryl diester phosphodiesterase